MKYKTLNNLLSLKNSILQLVIVFCILTNCSSNTNKNPFILEVYQTSKDGDNLKLVSKTKEKNTVSGNKKINLNINPKKQYQEYIGFGASFTESSAWNLAAIPIEKRKEVLTNYLAQQKVLVFHLQEPILTVVIIQTLIILM